MEKVKASLLNFCLLQQQEQRATAHRQSVWAASPSQELQTRREARESGCPEGLLECLTNVFLASEGFSGLLFCVLGLLPLFLK